MIIASMIRGLYSLLSSQFLFTSISVCFYPPIPPSAALHPSVSVSFYQLALPTSMSVKPLQSIISLF